MQGSKATVSIWDLPCIITGHALLYGEPLHVDLGKCLAPTAEEIAARDAEYARLAPQRAREEQLRKKADAIAQARFNAEVAEQQRLQPRAGLVCLIKYGKGIYELMWGTYTHRYLIQQQTRFDNHPEYSGMHIVGEREYNNANHVCAELYEHLGLQAEALGAAPETLQSNGKYCERLLRLPERVAKAITVVTGASGQIYVPSVPLSALMGGGGPGGRPAGV